MFGYERQPFERDAEFDCGHQPEGRHADDRGPRSGRCRRGQYREGERRRARPAHADRGSPLHATGEQRPDHFANRQHLVAGQCHGRDPSRQCLQLLNDSSGPSPHRPTVPNTCSSRNRREGRQEGVDDRLSSIYG